MSKKYNMRYIKTKESFTTKGISELLGVHPKTVQGWVRDGLTTISQRPILIMGFNLKSFLEHKQQNRKCTLEPDQFYCTKCKQAVKTKDNIVKLKLTGKTLGRHCYRELIIQGICFKCSSNLNRFSHEGKLQDITENFQVSNWGEINDE